MKTYFDSSVLVQAALEGAPGQAAALAAVRAGGWSRLHALAEAFATLTGKLAVPAEVASASLRSFTGRVRWHHLTEAEVWQALEQAQAAGVRGAGVHDWLHITAARAAGCTRWATLNGRHFQPHAGPGETVWEP